MQTSIGVGLEQLCRRFLGRAISEDEACARRVRRELRDDERILPIRLAQAEARARRLVLANVDPERAFQRAIAWARGAIDSTSTTS